MIRLEISLKQRKTGMELHGCSCAYRAMEMYVLSKLSDCSQRGVSPWPFLLKN